MASKCPLNTAIMSSARGRTSIKLQLSKSLSFFHFFSLSELHVYTICTCSVWRSCGYVVSVAEFNFFFIVQHCMGRKLSEFYRILRLKQTWRQFSFQYPTFGFETYTHILQSCGTWSLDLETVKTNHFSMKGPCVSEMSSLRQVSLNRVGRMTPKCLRFRWGHNDGA